MVLPELPSYEQPFRNRMADEVDALSPYACPRQGNLPPECSALRVWATDHQWLRDQIRAAQ